MSLLGIDPLIAAVLVLTVMVGAVVQSVAGLGLGLVAAPIITLLEPRLMPVSLLVLGAFLPLITLLREHEDIDWRGLAWSLPSRLPGTWLGVVLLGVLTERTIGIVVAVVVLLGVALTAGQPLVAKTVPTLVAAGLVSGITSTTSAIGGPPVALVYQSRPAREIRTTLAVYFVVGAVISLTGLALGQRVTGSDLGIGLALVPALLIGSWVGGRLLGLVDGARMRTAVLGVCVASALVLLVRSL